MRHIQIYSVYLFILVIAIVMPEETLAVSGICEAQPSADCYYIAPTGTDSATGSYDDPFASTNPVIPLLKAGDYVYFRGGKYDESNRGQIVNYAPWLAHRYSLASIADLHGDADNPITFTAYPNEKPIIDLYALNPEFEPTALDDEPVDAFCLRSSSYIRITGFEIIHGSIHVMSGTHHVWIEDNHIHDLYTNRSNNGLIFLQSVQHVYVKGNTLHDTYERSIPDGDGGWKFNDEKSHYDAQHNGCITTTSGDIYVGYNNETSGPFEFIGNNIYDCPAKLFIKNPQGGSRDENGFNMVIQDNYFHGAGYLVHGLRSSHTVFRNNLCKDSCNIRSVGSGEYPHGESSDEIINEIDARDIHFVNNIFLNVDYFASIVGLGFGLTEGVYSTMQEDKLKFKNNIVFMAEAAAPDRMDWNSHGFIFGTSYVGQNDTEITPSKILSRIVSKNNCIVNELGNTIGFFKQFIVDESNQVDRIIGHTHEKAVTDFGIDGTGDAFFTDMNPESYFIDFTENDFSQILSSPCLATKAGLTDPSVFIKGADTPSPAPKNELLLSVPAILHQSVK